MTFKDRLREEIDYKGILIKEEVGFQPKPVKGEDKKDGKDKKEKKIDKRKRKTKGGND